MITEKNTLKSELIYSDDKAKRYSLYLEWQKQGKKATVIMVSAGSTNGIVFDHTTSCVVDNLIRLDYGAVRIVNLFASIGDGKAIIEKSDDEENLAYIKKAVADTDMVVYAVGTGHINNKSFLKRQSQVLGVLTECADKLYCIADWSGRKFYHPLCPKVRKWNIQPFKISELMKEENKSSEEVKTEI